MDAETLDFRPHLLELPSEVIMQILHSFSSICDFQYFTSSCTLLRDMSQHVGKEFWPNLYADEWNVSSAEIDFWTRKKSEWFKEARDRYIIERKVKELDLDSLESNSIEGLLSGLVNFKQDQYLQLMLGIELCSKLEPPTIKENPQYIENCKKFVALNGFHIITPFINQIPGLIRVFNYVDLQNEVPQVIGLYGNIINLLHGQETKYWVLRTILHRLHSHWSNFIEVGIFDALLPLFKASMETNENWTISLTTVIDKLIGAIEPEQEKYLESSGLLKVMADQLNIQSIKAIHVLQTAVSTVPRLVLKYYVPNIMHMFSNYPVDTNIYTIVCSMVDSDVLLKVLIDEYNILEVLKERLALNRDVTHCLKVLAQISNNKSNFDLMMENLSIVLPFLNSADPEKIRMTIFALNGCIYSAMDLEEGEQVITKLGGAVTTLVNMLSDELYWRMAISFWTTYSLLAEYNESVVKRVVPPLVERYLANPRNFSVVQLMSNFAEGGCTGYRDNPNCRLDDLIADAAHRFCTETVLADRFHYLNLLCYLSQMEHTRDLLSTNENFLTQVLKLGQKDVFVALSTRELFYLSVQISFLFITGAIDESALKVLDYFVKNVAYDIEWSLLFPDIRCYIHLFKASQIELLRFATWFLAHSTSTTNGGRLQIMRHYTSSFLRNVKECQDETVQTLYNHYLDNMKIIV